MLELTEDKGTEEKKEEISQAEEPYEHSKEAEVKEETAEAEKNKQES